MLGELEGPHRCPVRGRRRQRGGGGHQRVERATPSTWVGGQRSGDRIHDAIVLPDHGAAEPGRVADQQSARAVDGDRRAAREVDGDGHGDGLGGITDRVDLRCDPGGNAGYGEQIVLELPSGDTRRRDGRRSRRDDDERLAAGHAATLEQRGGIDTVGDDHRGRDRHGQRAAVQPRGHAWQLAARARGGRPGKRRVEGEGNDTARDNGVRRRRGRPRRQIRHQRCAEAGRGTRGRSIRLGLEGDRRPAADRPIARRVPARERTSAAVTGTAASCDGWKRLRKSWAPPVTTSSALATAAMPTPATTRLARLFAVRSGPACGRVTTPSAAAASVRRSRARAPGTSTAGSWAGSIAWTASGVRAHALNPFRAVEHTPPRACDSRRRRRRVRRVCGAGCRQTDASPTSLRRRASARRSLVPTAFTPIPSADAISA